MKDTFMVNNNYNFKMIKVKHFEQEYIYIYIYIYIYTHSDRSAVLTVEMGVWTVEEKLIQVHMLKLEVGSKELRADVP